MSGPEELRAQQRPAWLVLIGQRLKREYDAMAKPLPAPLALLLQRLEARTAQIDPVGAARHDVVRAIARDGDDIAGTPEPPQRLEPR